MLPASAHEHSLTPPRAGDEVGAALHDVARHCSVCEQFGGHARLLRIRPNEVACDPISSDGAAGSSFGLGSSDVWVAACLPEGYAVRARGNVFSVACARIITAMLCLDVMLFYSACDTFASRLNLCSINSLLLATTSCRIPHIAIQRTSQSQFIPHLDSSAAARLTAAADFDAALMKVLCVPGTKAEPAESMATTSLDMHESLLALLMARCPAYARAYEEDLLARLAVWAESSDRGDSDEVEKEED